MSLKFQQFAWVPQEDIYRGSLPLNDHELKMELQGKRSGDLQLEQTEAEQMLTELLLDKNRLKELVTDAMLDLKNQDWLNEGEPPLDRKAFRRKLIRIVQINVYSNGKKEIFFEDGGLFWGHWLVLTLKPDSSLDNVGLEG